MDQEIFAIYFPSWHPDRHYEKWYGKGFSEWELVKSTKPLFEGHYQPRRPLWGYFDESDPEMMARQCKLAEYILAADIQSPRTVSGANKLF